MKRLQFDLLVENILLAEGSTPKAELFQNKKFNLTKFKDKAEEAKEAMKMLAGAKWLGGINVEKIETVFNNLIENLGEEPITYSDLVTIIDNSMHNSFTRQDLRVKWGRQFRNMFERLNDIQETGENPLQKEQPVANSESPATESEPSSTENNTPTVSTPAQAPKESLDLISKRFWEKILDEGEYSRQELTRMMIEDNPDMEESDSTMKVSDLIMSGYLKKTSSGNYEAVDPSEEGENKEEEEGEGSGEISTLDPDELSDFGSEFDDSSYTSSLDNEGRPFNA
jgi:hypothetical protein